MGRKARQQTVTIAGLSDAARGPSQGTMRLHNGLLVWRPNISQDGTGGGCTPVGSSVACWRGSNFVIAIR